MKTEKLIEALVHDLAMPVTGVGAALWRQLPLAIAFLACWLVTVGIRGDVLLAGLTSTTVKVALGLVLATIGLVAAVRLSRPEAVSTKPLLATLAVPAVAGLAMLWEVSALGLADWPARFWGHSFLMCIAVIPALAALPLLLILVALRNGATSRPATVGALAGLGAAGIAVVAYGLHCTEDSSLFIGTWYLVASLVTAGLGAAAGRVLLRW